ncbi:hypothetical protein EMIHUDRAFT_441833 [Emiliania huxleyi CCMP1516]|uniref:Uncharacterized protein n=3 Tax=Emiliania huxleyi TaxID=2903 RepID=A0A0D3JLB2_EMIH1|nr:hypothetical protein EMIHUDRAFT_443909 [Emiliania huxleyi CCMP1516]XP_005785035.1 hypothetical protein EMIHUDRAFT_441833 [Emiliania huxleyi CCMP1516]EOD24297.1 hypothetical protein EMIHUDRAFT_443909 [Emiliania huxleyi CCMP1516]EOD32606.1 hypothetical protein EMIHUDRAFT_441833 [Emiliania huxleyi CCMP1516]|eukprot:XP_005776726.1 hypothetical protein EMIHUDRAFT_443909 [Emiliania huxleyi CCMP1516]
MITSGRASDRSRCTSPLIAAVTAFLLLLTVASHYGASALTERATFLPQPDGHLLFQTQDVDRIAIRWEDCGVDSMAVSRAVRDAAWATEDPLDDEVPPQRYAGRVVDVAVLHTATGAAVDPPLTLPLGYNMSVVLTIDLPAGAPNATYFEEQTIGFPFSATGSSCEPGVATLPMGAGGTWGAGFHCPLPPGRHQSVVTVVTPRELPIPWYIDISALEAGLSISTERWVDTAVVRAAAGTPARYGWTQKRRGRSHRSTSCSTDLDGKARAAPSSRGPPADRWASPRLPSGLPVRPSTAFARCFRTSAGHPHPTRRRRRRLLLLRRRRLCRRLCRLRRLRRRLLHRRRRRFRMIHMATRIRTSDSLHT